MLYSIAVIQQYSQTAPLLGTRTRVSEVLNRERARSIGMIRRLHAKLGINPTPAGVETGAKRAFAMCCKLLTNAFFKA
jgi:hypothetical protein